MLPSPRQFRWLEILILLCVNTETLSLITFENRNVLAAFPICRVVPEFNIFSIFQFNLIITIPAKQLIHSVFCKVLKEKNYLLIYVINNHLEGREDCINRTVSVLHEEVSGLAHLLID